MRDKIYTTKRVKFYTSVVIQVYFAVNFLS